MSIRHVLLAAVLLLPSTASANDPPDTWFAGPDLTVFDARFGWLGPPRSLDIGSWSILPDLSGSVLSCDSLRVLPHERGAHKTFFEIYGNRLFVRSENDTVHMNSWILVHGGGSDADSPYLVKVDPSDPALADTFLCAGENLSVIRPAGVNGSPIGFRMLYGTLLDPAGPFSVPSQSPLFPVFDPAAIFRAPTVGGYRAMIRSGRVYLVLRAQDGDDLLDPDVPDAQTARAIADHVDGGSGTPEENALRHKILTFYVNKAPFLNFANPAFLPQPHQTFPQRSFTLNLLADDVDPYDLIGGIPPAGGPTPTKVLRWNVTLRGFDSGGQPVSQAFGPFFTPLIPITLPTSFADRHVMLEVELCDCATCEALPGQGRCVTDTIPIEVEPDIPTSTLASLIEADASSDRVRLTWQLGVDASARVERRETDTPWLELGEAVADGERVTFEDRTVAAGRRYLYRLGLQLAGTTAYAGETSVDIPLFAAFALEAVRPNPSRGSERQVELSLPSEAPARLETYDMTGRRLASQPLGTLRAGRHVVDLNRNLRLPPGIYWVRLIQGARSSAARIVVIE